MGGGAFDRRRHRDVWRRWRTPTQPINQAVDGAQFSFAVTTTANCKKLLGLNFRKLTSNISRLCSSSPTRTRAHCKCAERKRRPFARVCSRCSLSGATAAARTSYFP
jgi:hypothetical protein